MPDKPTSEQDTEELPGVAAVSRAMTILCSFGDADTCLGLAEISRRTGLYKSTVLRLSESLEAYGFLARSPDGDFRLGLELARLGALARRSVDGAEHIETVLRDMTRQTGESATYYVRRGDRRLALYRVDSSKTVRDHIRVGDLLPLKVGAAGRVLSGSARKPNNGKWKILVSLGQRDPEVAAVAGPVYSGDELVGCLSVSGPISRFVPEAVTAMSAVLEEKCRTLSKIL
jgi:DNA-binding IclR family transcriptional regulator